MNSPKYMVVSPATLALIEEVEAEYQKWHVDLFTPKGLELLFRRENELPRPASIRNQTAMGG